MEQNNAPLTSAPVPTDVLAKPSALFSESWSMLKDNWRPLATIAVVPSILIYSGEAALMNNSPILAIIGAVVTIAGCIYSVVMQPALIQSVRKISAEPGSTVSFMEQYSVGFRYFWAVLGLMILQTFILLGASFLLIIPAIWVGVYASLIIYVRVLDGKGGLTAFTESYSLIKGRWWKVFGRLAYVGVILGGLSLVMAGLSYIVSNLLGFYEDSMGSVMVSNLLFLPLISVIGPLSVIYFYKLYGSLKASRVAEVATGGFKKWLIAFIVLCVIGIPIVLIFIAVPLALILTSLPATGTI